MFDQTDFIAALHQIKAGVDEMATEIEAIVAQNVGTTIEVPVALLGDFLSIMRSQSAIATQVVEVNATIIDMIEKAANQNE